MEQENQNQNPDVQAIIDQATAISQLKRESEHWKSTAGQYEMKYRKEMEENSTLRTENKRLRDDKFNTEAHQMLKEAHERLILENKELHARADLRYGTLAQDSKARTRILQAMNERVIALSKSIDVMIQEERDLQVILITSED